MGHKLGGGALGTIGGMIAGVVGANALEGQHKKYAPSTPPLSLMIFFGEPFTDRCLRIRVGRNIASTATTPAMTDLPMVPVEACWAEAWPGGCSETD